MSGLYLHIPYCRSKCLYCDFYSVPTPSGVRDTFVYALLAEYWRRKAELTEPVRTLYIGGGTPSLLNPDQLTHLVDALALGALDEFTVEANPDDVAGHPDIVGCWRRLGVTRVSMGVQTFDDSLLRSVGRRHSAETAVKAVNLVREMHGDADVSIDLIFGLPGQTMASWQDTVQKALTLRPEHISCYSLMYEQGTALTRLRDAGRVKEIPDDVTEAMYQTLASSMDAAGYEQYEISNFCLPGHRSRHNSSYWTGVPYLGLGPGAHSYDGGKVRRANPADMQRWLEGCYSEEVLTDDELREEMVMTRMRMREGLDMQEYAERFGDAERRRVERCAAPMMADGLLQWQGDAIALTRQGILLSDRVIVNLI